MSCLKVTMLSHTEHPKETIYAVWQRSRTEGRVLSAEQYAEAANTDAQEGPRNYNYPFITEAGPTGWLMADIERVWREVITSAMPILEMIQCVFMIENISISLREQMVRHRIGSRFGNEAGVDVIPEFNTSTWWSQTTRVKDMGEFALKGKFRRPDFKGDRGSEILYNEAMVNAAEAYRTLRARGVDIDIAREVLPMAIQHHITWSVNLASIRHILSKRTCWVPQLDLWKPLIDGMLREIHEHIDPKFGELIEPPCVKRNVFQGCVFQIENANRVKGVDPAPPCPAYLNNHREHAVEAAYEVAQEPEAGDVRWDEKSWIPSGSGGVPGAGFNAPIKPPGRADHMLHLMNDYAVTWHRDPVTMTIANDDE